MYKNPFPDSDSADGSVFLTAGKSHLFFGVQKGLKESSEVKTNCFTNLHRLVFSAKMSNDFPHKDWIKMFFLCEHWLFFFLFVSGHSECPHEMFCWIFSRFFCAGWPEGEHSRIRWEPQNWLQYHKMHTHSMSKHTVCTLPNLLWAGGDEHIYLHLSTDIYTVSYITLYIHNMWSVSLPVTRYIHIISISKSISVCMWFAHNHWAVCKATYNTFWAGLHNNFCRSRSEVLEHNPCHLQTFIKKTLRPTSFLKVFCSHLFAGGKLRLLPNDAVSLLFVWLICQMIILTFPYTVTR